MKKKYIIISTVFLLALMLICGALLWYFLPKTYLKDVKSGEIVRIEVFNGSTGNRFTIENADEIDNIVKNMQSIELQKEKLSVGYDGFSFYTSFYNKNGELVASFIINGEQSLCDDPFFYKPKNGKLCYEYLRALEKQYVPDYYS